jgi:hypothetical protein
LGVIIVTTLMWVVLQILFYKRNIYIGALFSKPC